MSFLFKKRINNKMKKQLVNMYWTMMGTGKLRVSNCFMRFSVRTGFRLNLASPVYPVFISMP